MPHKTDVDSNDHTSTITNTTTTTTHHTTTGETTNDNDKSTAPTKPKATTTPSTTTTTTPTTPPTTTTTTTNNNNNNNTAPPKRTTIPLADGWTLVSTTKSQQHRLRKNNKKKNKKGSSGSMQAGGGGGYSGLASPASLRAAHEPAGPAKLMPGASKEWLLERLGKFRERWGECACRRGIGEVLGRAGVAGAGSESGSGVDDDDEGEEGGEGGEEKKDGRKNRVVIRNAVCVGLGSLSVDNVAAGVRSMWQLVCFLDMVGMLSGAGGRVKMYAEDPVFNALDVEVFEELGITVVHGLRSTDGSRQEGAAQFIEPDSFVFAPFMPSFIVLEDFLADRDPAIYVGNDVLATLELARSQVRYSGDVDERTRRCIRVADEFLAQGREVVTLPEFELHEHALAGQMIYWRKPAEEP
ncbi:hypothetical protein SLS58_008638 [Diplodia intermedia]|uniref:SRR1-like domain-containing protein n=1 Tax=Diplodia intermedia TaxID=856260 RepID=A0ABR3TGT6_9PEZI